MRILQVNNLNQVATIYGNDFVQRGHSVRVFDPSEVGAGALLPIKLAMIPWRLFDLGHIVGKLNSDYFDILHIHWASYGVLGLVSHIPFLVHCRGHDVLYRLQQPLFRPMLTAIFRRAAAVMCTTPNLLPVIKSVRSDVIFSPAPVDTERFRPNTDEQPSQSRPWTILLFARLDPYKGIDIATQGIGRFVQRHADVRVRLLDWGTQRKKYKQQYGERFEFVPYVAPSEVENLIHSSDVIVGQFALGAIGLAELQSMSCAKPVIASFRYNEAYPTPPPLCQATTAEEIDGHLEYLFQHPEAAMVLGQQAREWVIRYHDHWTLSGELEALYRSILGIKNA